MSDSFVDTYSIERSLKADGYHTITGIDEAGRGPLAGPVVAGSVILPENCDYHVFKDSKKLSPAKRKKLFGYLHDCGAKIGVGVATAREIEEINILQASLLAMKRAVLQLESIFVSPDYLLVDGKFPVPLPLPQKAIIRGESASASIAAASIIAKVTRDGMMAEFHNQYPVYNFIKNQGYPTLQHREAIARFGPCLIHRKTFKGVRQFLSD